MKALLYSGGLDSTCLWWILDKPPALFFGGPNGPAREAALGEAGAVSAQAKMCPEFADKLVVSGLDFSPFMRQGQWEFPRDELQILAAYGLGFDGASFGWCADDGMTEEKAKSAATRLRAVIPAKFPFTVDFPGWRYSKRELVDLAIKAGAPRAFIEASHSCVTASILCGTCVNCRQRTSALEGG